MGDVISIQRPRVLALVPARGGSKAILAKNVRRVGGLPLVVRSVRDALAVAAIDRVCVTTDDPGIARLAALEGAEVIRRPAALASDEASTESAVTHALAVLAAAGEALPDIIVLLQCTSPFRGPEQLAAALDAFVAAGADSMLSVVRRHYFHWRSCEAGGIAALNYDPAARPRRQDHEGVLEETGSFYIFRRELFESAQTRLGGRVEGFEVPAGDAIEIDEPDDLARAQAGFWARSEGPDCLRGKSPWLVVDLDALALDGDLEPCLHESDLLALEAWRDDGGRVALLSNRPRLVHELGAERFHPERWAVGFDSMREAMAALSLGEGQSDWPCTPGECAAPVFALSAGERARALADLVDHLAVVGGGPLDGDMIVANAGSGACLDAWVTAMRELSERWLFADSQAHAPAASARQRAA